MDTDVLSTIIEFIETASPVVWSAALEQVSINTMIARAWMIGWAVLCGLAVLLSIVMLFAYLIDKNREGCAATSVALLIGAIFFGVGYGVQLGTITRLTQNPTWAAIRLILGLGN